MTPEALQLFESDRDNLVTQLRMLTDRVERLRTLTIPLSEFETLQRRVDAYDLVIGELREDLERIEFYLNRHYNPTT